MAARFHVLYRAVKYSKYIVHENLAVRLRQSHGIEIVENGGSIYENTAPTFDNSIARAFTQLQWQGFHETMYLVLAIFQMFTYHSTTIQRDFIGNRTGFIWRKTTS
jgi:hypothetical protein